MVEQGTFNPRVEGSIPSWLTGPHRLEAQDTALSRRLAVGARTVTPNQVVNIFQHTYADARKQARCIV